jgi:predicted dehydrogenase
MHQDKLRVALVGASAATDRWGARAHAPAFLGLPETELVAVCTSRPETAQIAKDTYGARYAFSDYHEMLKLEDIDMVSVALRVDLHYDVTMAALQAGKHVYCEWPLALNAEQGWDMYNLARKNNLRHAVGLQARYAPDILYLRDLIKDGYIGRPLAVNVLHSHDRGYWRKWSNALFLEKKELGGNALSIFMGHALDTALFCTDQLESLSATSDVLVNKGLLSDTGETIDITAPDNAAMIGRLRNGAIITVQVTWTADPPQGWQMFAYGTDGVLVATSDGNYHFKGITIRGAKRPAVTSDGNRGVQREIPDILPTPSKYNWTPEIPSDSSAFNVGQFARTFTQCIREGKDIHPNFLDGIHLHNILDAIDKSSDTHQWVNITSSTPSN